MSIVHTLRRGDSCRAHIFDNSSGRIERVACDAVVVEPERIGGGGGARRFSLSQQEGYPNLDDPPSTVLQVPAWRVR